MCFRLVGSDTAGAAEKLSRHANVTFVGERPYTELPFHLYGFDVCLMPFKVIPLTLATNPVKVYEYLAAGRSVVSVDLPELRQFGDLVFTAADHNEFVAKVKRALAEPPDRRTIARRQEFASRQTWRHRATALADAFRTAEEPRVSVVVLTYNNLPLTQACLKSLVRVGLPEPRTHRRRQPLDGWFAGVAARVGGGSTGHSPRPQRHEHRFRRRKQHRVESGLRRVPGHPEQRHLRDARLDPHAARALQAQSEARPARPGDEQHRQRGEDRDRVRLDGGDGDAMRRATRSPTRVTRSACSTVAFFCVMMRRAVFEEVGELCEEYCARVLRG